jgi:hypothetical protein
LRIRQLFNVTTLGVTLTEQPDRIVKVLLEHISTDRSAAIAPRRSVFPKGILMMVAVKGDPASGTIWIFDREGGDFCGVMFDEPHTYSDLTMREYEQLISEYALDGFAAEPRLIKNLAQPRSRART